MSASLTIRVHRSRPFALTAQIDCAAGELLAILGPSGSGKSTLVRLIAGLGHPESGSIECAGSIWFDSSRAIRLRPEQRRVGYVSQHYGLFPHMSALENVMAGLMQMPGLSRRSHAMAWLDRVNLRGLENRLPRELSGGQQQRVAVARALARDPQLLLLDEPFAALDRSSREALYAELALLQRDLGIPTVLVTHDLYEAQLLAQRVAILVAGRTLQIGALRDVMAHPVSEEAARVLGISQCFDGEIVSHDAEGGQSVIAAGPHVFQIPLQSERKVGDRVRWMIPSSGVRVRALYREEALDGPNRVMLRVERCVLLGDEARLEASLPGLPGRISLQLGNRLATELGLAPGIALSAAFRVASIHVFSEAPEPSGILAA